MVIQDESKIDYQNYKDINRRLLLEKETWTFYFLIFSFIRNNLYVLCKKRKRVRIEGAPTLTRKAQQLVSNLQIFDGIRGIYSLQICYALSFFCAQYQII